MKDNPTAVQNVLYTVMILICAQCMKIDKSSFAYSRRAGIGIHCTPLFMEIGSLLAKFVSITQHEMLED